MKSCGSLWNNIYVYSADVLFYCDFCAGEALRVLNINTALFPPKKFALSVHIKADSIAFLFICCCVVCM